MALTVQSPTSGELPISVKVRFNLQGGALAATPLPSGVTIAQPTDGALPILGAVALGIVRNGAFIQQLPL